MTNFITRTETDETHTPKSPPSPRQRVDVSLILGEDDPRRLLVLAVLLPACVRGPEARPVRARVIAVRPGLDVVHVVEHARGHGAVAEAGSENARMRKGGVRTGSKPKP